MATVEVKWYTEKKLFPGSEASLLVALSLTHLLTQKQSSFISHFDTIHSLAHFIISFGCEVPATTNARQLIIRHIKHQT